jgi:hypothetical protein
MTRYSQIIKKIIKICCTEIKIKMVIYLQKFSAGDFLGYSTEVLAAVVMASSVF